jgi:Penicillinase repressor
MATMNNGDTGNPLAEAAEKIRREAYAQGWRDAVAALNKAAGEITELGPADIGSGPIDFNSGPQSASGVTQGSTPWYVLQAVRKRHGMTGSEVVSVVQEGGHKVSSASIRTSLMRLEHKKLIVSRHKKWFPA